jgi:hypothetical protein
VGEDDSYIKAVLIVLRNLRLQFKIHVPFNTEALAKASQEVLHNNGLDAEIDHDVHRSSWDLIIM